MGDYMKILFRVMNTSDSSILNKVKRYLLIKNDKYNGKSIILSTILNLIDKQIDIIYKRETITINKKIDIEKIIKSNPQFKMIDTKTLQVPTRNLLYINKYSGFRKNREIINILNNIEYLYQKMINNICILGYSININTPIELMALYYILCRYNFLSYNILDKEDCNTQVEKYTKDKLGYNVLLGHAVCRHHSVFFRDLCLRYGFKAKTVICSTMNGNEEEYYGHSFNEILYNGMNLYLDAYNGLSFIFDKNKHLVFSKDGNRYFIKDKIPFRYMASLLGFYQISKPKKKTMPLEEFKSEFDTTIKYLESEKIYPFLKEFAIENCYICDTVHQLIGELKYEILINQQKKMKTK